MVEILFLQWPVVFVVVGCDFDGWLWLCYLFFYFFYFFFLQWVVVAMMVPVACGGGGGLWVLQW